MSDGDLRSKERQTAGGDPHARVALMRERCRAGQCCHHAPIGGTPAIPDLPNLWYENENGERWAPPQGYNGDPAPPPGFVYQHSRFASQIRHGILRLTQRTEVDSCPHGEVRPTGGWIDGWEGRRCHECQGSQTREVNADDEMPEWPETWDAQGSTAIMDGNMGWSPALVTELVKHGADIMDAIVYAAVCCERCWNVAAFQCGLPDGYAKDSPEYAKAGTSCELCVPESYANSTVVRLAAPQTGGPE